MEQISQNITNKYKTTSESLTLDATKRISNGKYSINGEIRSSDGQVVASVYIEESNNVASLTLPIQEVFNVPTVLEEIQANIFKWTQDLINAPATPSEPTTETAK